MSIKEELQFSKDWTNPVDFPTYEGSEIQVRADQQYLYNEIRDYINSLVAALDEAGVEKLVQSESFRYLRINSNGQIEVSPDGEKWYSVAGGGSGTGEGSGADGGYYLPEVSEEGDLSWTPSLAGMPEVETVNIRGPAGADGIVGKDGEDGVSPTVEMTKVDGVLTIRITDVNGTQEAQIYDGKDGEDGEDASAADYSELKLQVDEISATVGTHDGDISQLKVDQEGIETRVETNEGDISTLQQTAESLESRIEDNEGNISTLEQTSTSLESRISDAEDNYSSIDQKVDNITLSVVDATNASGTKYATIKLTVGDNVMTGQILMEGNINVSGQLSATELYSTKGDIADLQVDKLSTSRRIPKYLAGDTSDDNYLKACDETLSFISGVYAEATEQATDPYGIPLYWESDPDEGTLGTDGYPYLDGVRIFTTTAETDYPVYVYTYTELVKAKFAFDTVGGYYTPVLTFGAGDENGCNIGTLMKSVEGLSLLYTATSGKEIGITMSDDGYLDITGQRAITAISVTEDSDGTVTVVNTLEGDQSETIVITPDDNGNPASMTVNGTAIPITWVVNE